jgi:EAL domain-containing protein (putative c-di-GMP-specific phosphodiesterase class I)
MAMARFWEWERTVERELPRVIAQGDVEVLFQPVYRIAGGIPAARGFEVVIRFPAAPNIPLGLWPLVARERSLSSSLEMTSVRAAFGSVHRVHPDAFLCVNASPEALPRLAGTIPSGIQGRLLIDLPYAAIRRPGARREFETARRGGAGVAIEVAVEDLERSQTAIVESGPDCLKVDVSSVGAHETLPHEILARASDWCGRAGITLIAERVERVADLAGLESAGIEWAQGHCLSPPIDL